MGFKYTRKLEKKIGSALHKTGDAIRDTPKKVGKEANRFFVHNVAEPFLEKKVDRIGNALNSVADELPPKPLPMKPIVEPTPAPITPTPIPMPPGTPPISPDPINDEAPPVGQTDEKEAIKRIREIQSRALGLQRKAIGSYNKQYDQYDPEKLVSNELQFNIKNITKNQNDLRRRLQNTIASRGLNGTSAGFSGLLAPDRESSGGVVELLGGRQSKVKEGHVNKFLDALNFGAAASGEQSIPYDPYANDPISRNRNTWAEPVGAGIGYLLAPQGSRSDYAQIGRGMSSFLR